MIKALPPKESNPLPQPLPPTHKTGKLASHSFSLLASIKEVFSQLINGVSHAVTSIFSIKGENIQAVQVKQRAEERKALNKDRVQLKKTTGSS